DPEDESAVLPEMPLEKQVMADYHAVGLSLKAHPFSLVRSELDSLGVTPAAALAQMPDSTPVTVAGLVLVRQQPGTANGIIFATLEDETGVVNLIIRPTIWQRYRSAGRGAVALLAQGKLQQSQGITHVLPHKLTDLSGLVPQLASLSRDFR